MTKSGTPVLSDEQLVKEYLKGDNNSLGILYSRYYTKVFHKCHSFTKNQDDAFDLAQDVLMKAFSNAGTFKGDSKFSTWLFSITYNHCISSIKKSKKVQFNHIRDHQALIVPCDDHFEFEERRSREEKEMEIIAYISELSDTDKELLDLKYHHKYSISELQDKFNLSASAVKMRLMRARKKVETLYTNKVSNHS